jgi:hypothetical protein
MKAKRDSCFIRSKVNKGKTYWYLVRCQRVDGKPRQQVIAYLGNQQPKDVTDARRIMGERTLATREKDRIRSLGMMLPARFILLQQNRFNEVGKETDMNLSSWEPCLHDLLTRLQWRIKHSRPSSRHTRKQGRMEIDNIKRVLLRVQQTPRQTSRMIGDSQTAAFFRDGWKRAAAFDPRAPGS